MVNPEYRYPGTNLSRVQDSSSTYVDSFRGEANKLLYELKNLMTFRNLGQLRMTRFFTDAYGTVIITAWSYINPITNVAQDFVNIDTSFSTFGVGGIAGAKKECTITFIEFPSSVPPMKNPSLIKPDEVSGVDYFKTYYTLEIKNCPNCKDVSWEFTFTYTKPDEPRHYTNPLTGKEELDNHTIYSMFPPARGELLGQGEDGNGKYITWKAYTELGVESRTGLGIMLLRAIVNDENMVELCSQQQKIDVDCCLKDADLRRVEIWWEDFGVCEPFMFYGDIKICKMPTALPQSELRLYSLLSPYDRAPLYAIPEVKGGCIPFEWTLAGEGELIFTDGPTGMHTGAYFVVNREADCHDTVIITLKDRCGTEYVVSTTDPCPGTPLSIGYTTLAMQCNDSQTLNVVGGVGPYTWELSGGGSISFSVDGVSAGYQSPSSNANCAYNATITVRDCCGDTASIQIASNCSSDGGAYLVYTYADMGVGPCGTGRHDIYMYTTQYRCDGTVETGPNYYNHICVCQTDLPPGPPASWCQAYPTWYPGDPYCKIDGIGYCHYDATAGNYDNGEAVDIRNALQKAAGCCPLNPYTGLPF